MSLPDQTAATAASVDPYGGLFLVPALPTGAPAESSNLLYRVAAVGAALFLVTTVF
jgi:hypothetical protein